MSGNDPTNVVTSQHIASLKGAINIPEKFIKKIETMAGQDIPFFKQSRDDLHKAKAALLSRLTKLEDGVGTMPRTDSSFTSLIEAIKAYGKKAETDAAREHVIRFFVGTAAVGNASALESQVKGKLPASCKSYASQAVNDVLGKDAVKDAGKVGPGVKHASAGKNNVKDASCSIFFTREEEDLGMKTVIKVVGVGSHTGPHSYMIHWSSVAKLKEGSEFTL
jgi:hypothetical protein